MEWLKELLGGKKLIFNLWVWIGGLAALLFWCGVFSGTTGVDWVRIFLQFLGLPDGAPGFITAAQAWMNDRAEYIVAIATLMTALAASVLVCSSHSRAVIPSGPAAPTLYVALFFGQAVGGINLLIVAGILAVILLVWLIVPSNRDDFWECLGIAFVEVLVQTIYVPLVLILALLFPKD